MNASLKEREPALNALPPIPDARLRYHAAHLNSLGERPIYEFLREVLAGRDIGEALEDYARLPADLIKAHGGDRFLRPFAINGGRR